MWWWWLLASSRFRGRCVTSAKEQGSKKKFSCCGAWSSGGLGEGQWYKYTGGFGGRAVIVMIVCAPRVGFRDGDWRIYNREERMVKEHTLCMSPTLGKQLTYVILVRSRQIYRPFVIATVVYPTEI